MQNIHPTNSSGPSPSGNIRRREALAITAAGAMAIAHPAFALAPEEASLDIIDCHTHFYDPSRAEGVPWPPKNSGLYRTVLPKHLRELPMYRPVTGTVVVEASPWVEDNAWLLELAENDPFIVGIVGNLDPSSEDFTKNLDRFAANPLYRGIRVNYPALEKLAAKNGLSILRQLSERDLELDVNGGIEGTDVVPKIAAAAPKLRIVINHIGNVGLDQQGPPQGWVDRMKQAAALENTFCKISALVEGAARGGKAPPNDPGFYQPYIDTVWNAFGEDRVIYGSNWPVSERAADYATLQKIVIDDAARRGDDALRKFCSLNAKQAYKWVERDGRR
ncbi:MAG: amidohydrolase family protein [Pirellulaceae bacterium]